MIWTALYVLGPTLALVLAGVLYVLERGPVVLPRWLKLIDEIKARRLHKREAHRSRD